MRIPLSFGNHLKKLKADFKLRGLDQVVSALIRRAMSEYSSNDLVVPPPPDDHETTKEIAVHIPREHYEYLQAVAHRNRGIPIGVALETVAAHVRDLTPPLRQLSLMEREAR